MDSRKYSILLVAVLALGLLGTTTAEGRRKKTAPTVADTVDMAAEGHQRINLWEAGTAPNSRGVGTTDSIFNHRIWRTGEPRLYVYQPVKEERTGAAVVIIPGGGYVKQAYEVSGISMAKWFNTFGVTAFILLHRLPNQSDLVDGSIAPTQDAQRAIRLVRARAAEFGIDPQRIGVMGTSAGGHVCACVSTITDDLSAIGDSLDGVSFRPDYAILVSPLPAGHPPRRPLVAGALLDGPAGDAAEPAHAAHPRRRRPRRERGQLGGHVCRPATLRGGALVAARVPLRQALHRPAPPAGEHRPLDRHRRAVDEGDGHTERLIIK